MGQPQHQAQVYADELEMLVDCPDLQRTVPTSIKQDK
jgi:hypothetical protein